jgi:hypothetical protein
MTFIRIVVTNDCAQVKSLRCGQELDRRGRERKPSGIAGSWSEETSFLPTWQCFT